MDVSGACCIPLEAFLLRGDELMLLQLFTSTQLRHFDLISVTIYRVTSAATVACIGIPTNAALLHIVRCFLPLLLEILYLVIRIRRAKSMNVKMVAFEGWAEVDASFLYIYIL